MSTYSSVLTEVLRLTPDEQLRLISELLVYVRHRFQPKPKRSILELEGLGEEIWHGIDAQEYREILLNQESLTVVELTPDIAEKAAQHQSNL
ncbi:MAG TPA: hypothetical protein V6D21_08885 [Candidatus Obscuribacterales bacterium]